MPNEIKLLLRPEVSIAYAMQLKRYCANQKDCTNCAFNRPKRYPYDSTCAIANTYEPPEGWDLDNE